jgi:hypothetical protein
VDIHSPENSIRTWRDFLLHLLTITIGLFIALMLEAAVESMHNRHLVREARENLRSEIESNHQLYAENARKVAKESGAVPHMDSRSISDYTWLYDQQVCVMSMALTLLNEESRINAVLVVAQEPLKLLPAEIESLMIRTAEIDLEASRLQTWMKALDDMYSRALTQP